MRSAWPRRIGACSYLLGVSGLLAGWSVAALLTCHSRAIVARLDPAALGWLLAGGALVALALAVPLTLGRLRDLAPSTDIERLMRLPFLAPLALLALCRLPGTRAANAHGPARVASGGLKKACAAVAAGSALLLVVVAMQGWIAVAAAT